MGRGEISREDAHAVDRSDSLLSAAQAELGLSLLNAAVFSLDMRSAQVSLQWSIHSHFCSL